MWDEFPRPRYVYNLIKVNSEYGEGKLRYDNSLENFEKSRRLLSTEQLSDRLLYADPSNLLLTSIHWSFIIFIVLLLTGVSSFLISKCYRSHCCCSRFHLFMIACIIRLGLFSYGGLCVTSFFSIYTYLNGETNLFNVLIGFIVAITCTAIPFACYYYLKKYKKQISEKHKVLPRHTVTLGAFFMGYNGEKYYYW